MKKKNNLKGIYISSFILIMLLAGFIYSQMTVEKTIPERIIAQEVKTGKLLRFSIVWNFETDEEGVPIFTGRQIRVLLKNGIEGFRDAQDILDQLTTSEKNAVKKFVRYGIIGATGISADKLTGDF